MKTKRKGLLVLMMVLVTIFNMTISSYANDKKGNVEEFIKQTVTVDSSGVLRYSNGTVKAYVKDKADSNHTQAVTLSDGKTVIFYNSSAVDMLDRQATKYFENAKVGEKVNDITDNMNIEANTGAAAVMLSGFKPIIELGIGIIVVLITFGMILFSSFDIAYIAFPIFRNKMEDAKQNGNAAVAKKTANGDTQLRWVTDDAQYAVTQGTIDSGKSPWKLYFTKRIASYIFLGIILTVLMTGNITIITNLAVNVVSGVIDILSGLAS